MAAIQLAHLRKQYMYGRENVEKIMAAGEGEWLKPSLSSSNLAASSPADAAEILEKRHHAAGQQQIEKLLSLCKSFHGRVDFEFVETQTPNGFAARHPKDGSHAIGLDPSLWHVFSTLTLAAGMAEQANEPKLLIGAAQRLTISAFLKGALPPSEFEEILRLMWERAPAMLKLFEKLAAPFYVDFLLAHEVGHIELGHLNEADVKRVQLDPAQEAVPLSALDWEHEFAADRWALEALLTLAGSDNTKLTLVTTLPAIYFDLAALVERLYVPQTDVGRILRDTHPPPRMRADRCRAWAATHTEIPPNDAMALLVKISWFVRSVLPKEDS